METGLKGKRALVTGAASGIGKAIAKALVAEGVEVVGLDIEDVSRCGFEVIGTDIASVTAVDRGIEQAIARLGGLDILVNCAGIEIPSSLRDIEIADMDRMIAVNLRGPILVTRAALRHLSDGARIVNIASELAYLGRAGSSVYAATKGAMLSLSRSWAREFSPNILVNAVAPGPIDTPLLDFDNAPAEVQALDVSNPLGRIGRPEEVASIVVFLASERCGYVTGQCFSVDGGAAMH
ncbi:SDR family oxidoreductase [Methyloligella sp. 2.7D]|uniref:SDR family NAD(P)-dependent oxidoreductase n=1 Tax=unclassified Methyloligella TaxID=2625955 RepID=UPI00157D8499|nr:SDR family oxidoreductase [Methyloligella sp. GL2]QKP76227.1 SDR family oxidoreductase [Methyloligella sp. GL2]